MWQYCWTYETDLPSGSGFALFSATHLGWIAGSLLIVLIVALIYRRLKPLTQLQTEQVLAVMIALSYILRWIWAALIGHFYAGEMLPLHLCAVSALVEITAVFSRKAWLKDFGYACGIPGAVVAFILPGIGPYPVWHFYYLLFTLDHVILILLPIIWLLSGKFRPNYRNLPRVLGLLLVMAVVADRVNRAIGSNFMFITFIPPGTPLTAFAMRLGNPGYQLIMAFLLFLIWFLMYLPMMIRGYQQKQ